MSSYFVTMNGNEYTITFELNGGVLLDGKPTTLDVQQVDTRTFSVLGNAASDHVVAEKTGNSYRLLVNGKQIEALVESERTRLLKKFATTSDSGRQRTEIHAPMPALVVKVEVSVGDDVVPGQGLVVLEAMKMENEIKSHFAGKVKEIHVTKGKAVEKGELLILLE